MQKETDLNVTISNLNATKIHLQFKENADLKEIETVFVCKDYGNFFLLKISKFKIFSAFFLGERNGILLPKLF